MMTAVLVVLFFVILIAVGYLVRKWVAGGSDFLLGSREISVFVNTMNLCAIAFAGTSLTLVPGFTVRYGAGASLFFIFCFTILGISGYGLLLARVARLSGAYTLPELLEMRYSRNTRAVLGILGFASLMGITANNVLSLANVVAGFAGWPLQVSITAGIVCFLAFTYFGGVWGVSISDLVQAIVCLIGGPVLVIALVSKFGPLGNVAKTWPGAAGPFSSGVFGSLPGLSPVYPSAFTFVLLYMIFLVWSSQHYFLRAACIRTAKGASQSFIWAGVLLFLMNCCLIPVGLYAGSRFPNLFMPVGKLLPEAAYGKIMAELPYGVGAFLLVVGLAASLSTAAAVLLAAISVATRDIYQRFINPAAGEKEMLRAGRVITVVCSILLWLLCYFPGGPVFLFAFGTAWTGPAGILFVLGLIWPRMTEKGAFAGALCGAIVMTTWTALSLLKIYPVDKIAHVGVVGLAATLVPGVIVSLVTRPKHYAIAGQAAGAGRGAGVSGRQLSSQEIGILDLVFQGAEYVADLIDILGKEGGVSTGMIENLEKEGYLERYSTQGSGLFRFRLSALGRQAVEKAKQYSEQEVQLSNLGLGLKDIAVLKAIEQAGGRVRVADLLPRLKDVSGVQLGSRVTKLERLGYLSGYGILRRYAVLTGTGRQMVQEYAGRA